MLNLVHKILAKVRGYNTESTPIAVILEQMTTPQPLPMGRKEFEAWSDRIISGALIPGATPKSLKFALAEMVMHAKPTDDHISDAYFVKCLRKAASNQICWAIISEFKAEQKAEHDAAVLRAQSAEAFEKQLGELGSKPAT